MIEGPRQPTQRALWPCTDVVRRGKRYAKVKLGYPPMVHSSDGQHALIAELVLELDRLAIDAMADWKVPGAALAVVQGGEVALAKAYGRRNIEANLPATAATQFLIGFRLHDAVATERVTVRDLLCHLSGLPRHDWVWLPGDRTSAELLAAMRYLEPSRDIRAAWQYNNLCYNVAGLLIERASGQSYEAFVRARLTDKLGMTVSFTLDDLEASADAARPYAIHENTRLPAIRLPVGTIAAGAINTSAADLANWMRLHLGKGEFGGERLLPATLIDALHARRVYYTEPGFPEFGQAYYGLGFRRQTYRGDQLVWHGGGLVVGARG